MLYSEDFFFFSYKKNKFKKRTKQIIKQTTTDQTVNIYSIICKRGKLNNLDFDTPTTSTTDSHLSAKRTSIYFKRFRKNSTNNDDEIDNWILSYENYEW